MRKLLIIFIALTVCVATLSADAYKDVNRLIANGYVKTNPDEIRTLSSALSQDQITNLLLYTFFR